jgi:predicted transcriptional regulator
LYCAFRKATGKKVKEIRPHFSLIWERHEVAHKMIREGISISEAARAVGITKQAVSQWIKKNHIALPVPATEQSKAKARELIRTRALCVPEIAVQTCLSESTVRSLARKEQTKLPRSNRRPKDMEISFENSLAA